MIKLPTNAAVVGYVVVPLSQFFACSLAVNAFLLLCSRMPGCGSVVLCVCKADAVVL